MRALKALIIKDLLNLKTQTKTIVIIFIFYAAFSLSSDNMLFLPGMILFLMLFLSITSISYDERSKWDKYALTMPISRANIVIGKYLLGLILGIIALVINLIFALIFIELSVHEIIAMQLAIFAAGLLFLAVMLPPLFKYGVEKGRFIIMLIGFGPAAIIVLLSKMQKGFGYDLVGYLNNNISNNMKEIILNSLPYLLVIVAIIIIGISINSSLRIYNNKEM